MKKLERGTMRLASLKERVELHVRHRGGTHTHTQEIPPRHMEDQEDLEVQDTLEAVVLINHQDNKSIPAQYPLSK